MSDQSGSHLLSVAACNSVQASHGKSVGSNDMHECRHKSSQVSQIEKDLCIHQYQAMIL